MTGSSLRSAPDDWRCLPRVLSEKNSEKTLELISSHRMLGSISHVCSGCSMGSQGHASHVLASPALRRWRGGLVH